MLKIACNNVPDHIVKMRVILESFAEVDYVEWDYNGILNNIGSYDVFIPSLKIALDEKIYMAAKNLKLIATPSTGTDHIDIEKATQMGIDVLSLKNDTEYLKNITSTAEIALALMLSTMRMIPFAFESVKNGIWDSNLFRGHSVSGKTLGIIGYGRLGEMMAQYGHVLRMKILATDPYKTLNVDYVKQVSLDELLAESDVISIHVHLNNETRGMIGKNEINKMKNGAIIINTSRGAVIDENALVEALKSGKLGGAGLDVLATELYDDIGTLPIVEYARNHKNVVITPHIGGVTYESQEMGYAKIAESIKEWYYNSFTK